MTIEDEFKERKMTEHEKYHKPGTFTEFLEIVAQGLPRFQDEDDLVEYLAIWEGRYLRAINQDSVNLLTKESIDSLHSSAKTKLETLSDNNYKKLTERQKLGYDSTLKILDQALNEGLLDKKNLSDRVLDFGCGDGGPSILLALNSEDVTAIDLDPDLITPLQKNSLFKGKAILGGGPEFMLQQPNASYDLITAFFLGYFNTSNEFVRDFYETSKRILTPTGAIIVSSDLLTMDKVRYVFGVSQNQRHSPEFMIYSNK